VPEYRLRPKAQADIEDIWNYTGRTWGIRQARKYISALRDACNDLVMNPDIGIIRDDLYTGLRVYSAGKHLIFYLTMERGIDVVRILHERMDSKRQLP